MPKPIIIFGAKDNAQVTLEILQKNKLMVYGFLEDDPTLQGQVINHVPILGTTKDKKYLSLLGPECHAFITVRDPKKRATILQLLTKRKLVPISAIHPSVTLADTMQIGVGNFIDTHTSIGPEAVLHGHCTLEAHVMIGHGVIIHSFVYIGAGSIINPKVTIHPHAHIGTGAILAAGITIGKGAQISPGTTVLDDVPAAVPDF